MRIAITGATGFLGSHLLDRLPADVTCLVRDADAAARLQAQGRRVVRGGLDDRAALDALVAGADVVFHVAGLIAGSEAALLAVNRDGTAAVAQAGRRAGVGRLVYVSSLAVTGPAERGRPVDETWPEHPVTAYGRSKHAGEEAVRESGAAFTIVRPPVVYGPRDRQTLQLFRLTRWGFVPLPGDGLQQLSLVHAADLADALLAAAAAPDAEGRVYHAAHPEVVTQRALMEAIARAAGTRPRLVPVPAAAVRAGLAVVGAFSRLAGRRTLVDPAKAPEFLAAAWTCATEALARDAGWRARVPLAQGLTDTAAWYRKAGWL